MCSIIYSQQNSSFLFLSLLYQLTFSKNCPIYFMTKYFHIFNIFLLNLFKIKFYNPVLLEKLSTIKGEMENYVILCLTTRISCITKSRCSIKWASNTSVMHLYIENNMVITLGNQHYI